MTTIAEILDAAYGRSKKTNPGADANEETELLGYVQRTFHALFALAARVNPTYFGDQTSVVHDGSTGWPRPTAAELVYLLEGEGAGNVAAGAEVIVVPFDHRDVDTTRPAVYRWGQIYRSAGNAPDPNATDTLAVFYSKRPEYGDGGDATPNTLDDTLDPLWPEAYNSAAILNVAIYLALKDERVAERESLRAERDEWLRLFIAHLEHETVGEVRARGHGRFLTETLVPISALFAGGSSVEV